MQFLKLSHELITDTNITSNEFRIYTYLLSLYNEAKQCAYPSLETISDKLNISIATVKRSIKRLVDLGYMVIEKRKGAAGNYNTYKELKHLVRNVTDSAKKSIKTITNKVTKKERKPVIVSDWKESGIQMELEELLPYSIEHQQKISLVLKYVKNLTDKQMCIIGEMDLELLRKALYKFNKKSKTKTFAFLIHCYTDECAKTNVVPSIDLQRYSHTPFIQVTEEQRERERLKALMIEDGIFDEQLWLENAALGL